MLRARTRTLPAPMFDDTSSRQREELWGQYGLLIAANVCAWIWAFVVFGRQPALLGTALLAYTFGLRHAVDADQIAAIDNVVRKPAQVGQHPLCGRVLLCARPFDRGGAGDSCHCSTPGPIRGLPGSWRSDWGRSLGAFSVIDRVRQSDRFDRVWRSFRHVRRDGRIEPEDLDGFVAGGGVRLTLVGVF
jgi:nickel/cobalt transporter (NiCoT) family protein